jgi:CRISPR-associated protein Cas1
MIKRYLEISSGPARLSLRDGSLLIARDGHESAAIPIEDIGILILDHPAVGYTHGALAAMMENNAAVVLCGGNHHPCGMLLPLEGNTLQAEAIAAQSRAPAALKGRIWKEVVRAKLTAQARLLARMGVESDAISRLAARVRTGDPQNIEARGAQRYWPLLLGRSFRRDRDGEPPNNLLNYGYMILRAAMARAICGAGLHPSLGVHHQNRYNAFALADDLMEPLRPAVDSTVRELWELNETGLSREARSSLLAVLNQEVEWNDGISPLFVAVQRYAASVRETLAGRRQHPEIPLPALSKAGHP